MAGHGPAGEDLARASDEELLARVARSDVEALGEIYRRHSAAVFFLAHQLLGSTRAEETTQDVFLYVWDHADELHEAAPALRAELLQRVRLQHLATGGAEDLVPGDDAGRESETPELTGDEQAALELALQGQTYREAAFSLGRSTEDVNELLRNALLKLYEGSGAPKDPRPP